MGYLGLSIPALPLRDCRGGDGTSGWLAEQLEGLSYLFFLRRLAEETEADWPAVRGRLEDIQRRLVSRRGLTVAVTADDGA